MKVKSIPIGFLAVLDEQMLEELVHDNHEAKCSATEPALYKIDGPEPDHDSVDLVTLEPTTLDTQSQPTADLGYKPAQSRHGDFPSRRAATQEKPTRSVLVSTTDMRLASDIGAAVRRTQCELDNLQQKGLRVVWGHC